MHLRPDEKVLRIIRRHPTPFIVTIITHFAVGAFFIMLIIFFDKSLKNATFTAVAILFVTVAIGFSITNYIITYRLDRLVVTSRRIIWINWKSIFRREEHGMDYKDIQDIHTREKGFLSYLSFLDYGLLQIETAASSTTIIFEDAPDPEGIREYILEHCGKARSV